MNDNENFISITRNNNMEISTKERGDIPYYTISQVAALLNESDSSIRYYTNLFDDILNIEIVNKEFRYTSKDVDNLDFLINLNNKGMTIKEIQEYCKELPFTKEEIMTHKSSNVSVNDVISVLMAEQTKNFNDLKNSFFSEIESSISCAVNNLSQLIIEEQNRQLLKFKENMLFQLQGYIEKEFEKMNEKNNKHNNALIQSSKEYIQESLDKNQAELENMIDKSFEDFKNKSITRDDNLIREVKKFKDVMQQAYFVQHEMDMQLNNLSLMERLFGLKKN